MTKLKVGDTVHYFALGNIEYGMVRRVGRDTFTTTANKLISKDRIVPDLSELDNAAIILRCQHTRGVDQQAAFAELDRRGLWLTPEQRETSRGDIK